MRTDVFIKEQVISTEEAWDAADVKSRHAIAYDAIGAPIGTGRLMPDGRIGRMAVLSDQRGRGVGTAILDRLLEEACKSGFKSVTLHAQLGARSFYEKRGFTALGEGFIELGIPHVEMSLALV